MVDQYYVYGVKLDQKEEHITSLKVRKVGAEYAYWVPRGFIAQLIQSGLPFSVRYKKNEKWYTGAEVSAFEGSYVRANPNHTALDNLRNLPRT